MKTALIKLVHVILVWNLAFGGYSNVLCFGDDGHVAIEPAFHNHCSHDEHDHAENQAGDSEFSDPCNPCEDVLMGNNLEPAKVISLVPISNVQANACLSVAESTRPPASTAHLDAYAFYKPLKSIRLLT